MAPRPVGVDYIAHLAQTTAATAAELARIPESVASWRPAPNKWSAKEIIGRHIAHLMAAVPRDARERAHHLHNLHEIGWRHFPADAPARLDDLMRDYVEHLEHHLAQVRDRVQGAPGDIAGIGA